MKINKKVLFTTSVLTLLPALVGLSLYNRLPAQMPIHWNFAGEVDGYCSRLFAVLGMPAFLLAVHLFCMLMINLDKKNQNQNKMLASLPYYICPVISCVVMGYVYMSALGVAGIGVEQILLPLLGVMFMVLGNYMPKCTHNHTIGIRLSTTLSSEANWDTTHRFAGKIWFAAGVLVLVCLFIPAPAKMWIAVTGMLAAALVPIAYSIVYAVKNK